MSPERAPARGARGLSVRSRSRSKRSVWILSHVSAHRHCPHLCVPSPTQSRSLRHPCGGPYDTHVRETGIMIASSRGLIKIMHMHMRCHTQPYRPTTSQDISAHVQAHSNHPPPLHLVRMVLTHPSFSMHVVRAACHAHVRIASISREYAKDPFASFSNSMRCFTPQGRAISKRVPADPCCKRPHRSRFVCRPQVVPSCRGTWPGW
jgi:hypothetical protein